MTQSKPRDWILRLEVAAGLVKSALLTPEGQAVRESASEVSVEDVEAHVRDLLVGFKDPDPALLTSLGREIGQLGFPPEITLDIAEALTHGRVRLGIELSTVLQRIPWELAYLDQAGIGFLAQNPGVRLYRRCPTPTLSRGNGTLRVLLAYADPQSAEYPALAGCEMEFQSVLRALESPECKGVSIERLEHATASSISRKLAQGRFDVFHFIGHGDLKPTGGLLVFEGGEPHRESILYGEEISELLRGSGVSLAFLSSCHSGGASASVAAQLSVVGVPAVIGMQTWVSDAVAHLFSRAFYAALASGQPVEEAVYQGRMAVCGTSTGWFAPVLSASQPSTQLVVEAPASKGGRGNLPKPITSFVGRAKEIEQIVELLETERLVILHGSGGIGKTRLSIEVGHRCVSRFPHGVWQVQLDTVSDLEEVLPAIAGVFDIRDAVEERLFEFLGDLELLIILDNCEHVVESSRSAAVRLLSSCPKVKLLATSRTVLDTGAEAVVAVPSLSYPPLGPGEPFKLTVEEALARYEALQLLTARGRSANSRFSPSEQNLEALCRIAKRVDGIPLAIELAASRLRSYTPAEISERLARDLAWLDEEAPGAIDRHKTLRATLDWSYRLLTFPEKALFIRLGVFPGSFSSEGAEAVASDDLEPGQVRGLLANLVDRSLVLAEEFGETMRYRLLDSCRAYAFEALEKAGRVTRVRKAFLGYMLELAKRLYEIEISHDVSRWLDAIQPEHDNLLAAIDWALSTDPVKAAQILYQVIDYWYFMGAYTTCAQLVDRALAVLPDTEEELQIRLNVLAGAFAVYRGQAEGLARIKSARDRALSYGEPNILRSSSLRLGECANLVGDEETAVEMFEWSIAHCREIGDPRKEGYVRVMLANIQIHRGNFEDARLNIAEALAVRERVGDISGAGIARCTLAYLEQCRGSGQAALLYSRGLRDLAAANNEYWLSVFLVLGASLLSDPRRAASVQGLAQRLAEGSGFTGEPYVSDWVEEAVRKTRERVGDHYVRLHNEGRTMNLEEALCALD